MDPTNRRPWAFSVGVGSPVIAIPPTKGLHHVSEPIVFASEDSGSDEVSITYAAWPGEKPVVSGGLAIGGWKKDADGPLWTTTVPAVRESKRYFRQLFVDGRRATPARFPNDDFFRSGGPGEPYKDRGAARRETKVKRSIHFQGEDLKPWSNLGDAIVVVYLSFSKTPSAKCISQTDIHRIE